MSANDKASATFGPGRTTPPLEARVAAVLAEHGQHDYMFNGGDWSDNCACGFKLFGIDYSPEHKVFPGRSYADCAHAAHVASMLAPVIRKAKAEALREAASDYRATKALGKIPSGRITDEQRAEYWAFDVIDTPQWLEYRADNLEKP